MLELKLRPPVAREGLVHRSRVLQQLKDASNFPVVSILGPAGYGKTTIMSQFRDELTVPAAWLTLDEADSDPAILLGSIHGALSSVGLIDPNLGREALTGVDALTAGVGALVDSIDSSAAGVLLIDQVDHLQGQGALDVIGGLMVQLAGIMRVVVASRSGDGLPLALLRSRGELFEITGTDLAMTLDEATAVFEATGVDAESLVEGVVEGVVRRTEGWPAGIYLTAMAIKAGSPSPEVHGDDVFLADYLGEELLRQVPEHVMTFLIETSILNRMSGPLCDYVLETEGSGSILNELERANLLIVPMDRTRTWYRYHSLLRDYLRSEVNHSNPERVATLHGRASAWYEKNGFAEPAIEHARAAGDGSRLADLVAGSARHFYSVGRVETLMSWLTSLEESGEIGRHPELAAVGSYARALDGDALGSERMAAWALDTGGSPRPDSSLGPLALMLRSYRAERGVQQALEDARAAGELIGAEDLQWVHPILGAQALATQAVLGMQAADPIWADGLWRSESLDAFPFTSAALAQRALISIDRGDWDRARDLINRSMAIVEKASLDRYITSALTFTLAARVAARAGDIEMAEAKLASAALIRPRMTVALPVFAVQNLHEMARAFVEIADIAGARRVMRDASDILAVRPRLGTLVADHEALKETLSALPAGSVGASSLTRAELRLLPLLVTHLTYPEIGERLYVSRHTVKTQAMSIYRKLGVSSRAAAVAKARDIGLLSV